MKDGSKRERAGTRERARVHASKSARHISSACVYDVCVCVCVALTRTFHLARSTVCVSICMYRSVCVCTLSV